MCHLILLDDKEVADQLESGDEHSKLKLEQEVEKEIDAKLKRYASYWKPAEYDSREAVWSYTLGKAAFDYASLIYIMKEMKRRDKKYQPRTLLDFGSGVGTALW